MSAAPVIVIEVVLVFGSVLAWGLYQLYQLRRDERRDDEKRKSEEAGDSAPKDKPGD